MVTVTIHYEISVSLPIACVHVDSAIMLLKINTFLSCVILASVLTIDAVPMGYDAPIRRAPIRSTPTTGPNYVGEGRIFFEQFTQVFGPMLPMFPIEINVPDALMGMLNGMMVMWNAIQEYFGNRGNADEPRITDILKLIL